MHDESPAAACSSRIDEPVKALLRVLVVDADAALDRHRYADLCCHGGDAFLHESGLGHEAGAEPTRLDAIRGTADIEVNLVIAEPRADARGRGETIRIAAAELQRNGMLGRIELEQSLRVPVQDGL